MIPAAKLLCTLPILVVASARSRRMKSGHVVKRSGLASAIALFASNAWSQQLAEFDVLTTDVSPEGWQGFTDIGFLTNAFLTLTLAAILGAVIAYHPRYTRTADTLEELEAPKVYIMYAVIGALIGIMVVKYGLIIGFVLFGIGGLIRFRTVLRSAHLTGHVILVSLIGLSTGLELPHVAVLATAFSFILIYVLDTQTTYRINIRSIPAQDVVPAAAAYGEVLRKQGCRILSEKKNPEKARVSLIFRTPRKVTRAQLEGLFESDIDRSLRGTLDWEID